MNVLGICGSPRANGNTAFALHRALATIEAQGIGTTYISLADKEITPCDGCFTCRTGQCVHIDDMALIFDAIRRCDGLLLASPVYMGFVSGQMKVMMHRTVPFRTGGHFELSGRVGAGITCGGFRNGGQELTLQCMHTFFLQQDMYVIADGPRFSHSGAAIMGSATSDELGLRTVDNLALRMAQAVRQLCGRQLD